MKTSLELWQFLSGNPIFWLSITLLAYQLGIWLYKKSGYLSICSPFVVCVGVLIPFVLITGTSYQTYFEGASMIHFLLGPATVALAVPLYDQRKRLAKLWLPILVGVLVGSTVGIISTLLLSKLFGASFITALSMIPKSVTTPIAMGVAEKMGGIAAFTATVVVFTGIIGGIIAAPLFRVFKIEKDYTKGFSLGLAAHGMGTTRAFQISEKAGAFSGLAIGLTGIVTAFLAPYLGTWLAHLLY